VGVIIINRQYQELTGTTQGSNFPDDIDAGDIRQVDVDEDHIRVVTDNMFNRILAIEITTLDGDIGGPGEQQGQFVEIALIILYDHQINLVRDLVIHELDFSVLICVSVSRTS